MEITRAPKKVAVFVLAVFLVCDVAIGQTAGGTILGKIRDQTGAVLPGAEVTIKNTATGVTRNILSDETGTYNAPNLQPGTYDVTVQMPSFGSGLRKDINLN